MIGQRQSDTMAQGGARGTLRYRKFNRALSDEMHLIAIERAEFVNQRAAAIDK